MAIQKGLCWYCQRNFQAVWSRIKRTRIVFLVKHSIIKQSNKDGNLHRKQSSSTTNKMCIVKALYSCWSAGCIYLSRENDEIFEVWAIHYADWKQEMYTSLKSVRRYNCLCFTTWCMQTVFSHNEIIQYVGHILAQCWATVCDAGPTLGQNMANVLFLRGNGNIVYTLST